MNYEKYSLKQKLVCLETKNYFVKIYQIVMCMESDLHKYIHDVHCVLLQFCGTAILEKSRFFSPFISLSIINFHLLFNCCFF